MADTKTYTTNYNLEKPGQDDFYNVDVFNANADKIDAEMKAAATRDTTHKSAATLDHPDNSVTDAKIGNRTITDTVTAAAGADTPTNLWSKLGNMVKQITGKTTWWTPPATTLEAAKAHADAAAPHSGHAPAGFGIGPSARIITGTDLNALRGNCLFAGYSMLHAPADFAGWIEGISISNGNDILIQLANTTFGGNRNYSRVSTDSGNTWSEWELQETAIGAQAKADAAMNAAIAWTKGYGIGSPAVSVSGTDLNNLRLGGFYRGANFTHGPVPAHADCWFFITVTAHDTGDYVHQKAASYGANPGRSYERTCNNGVWSEWERMAMVSELFAGKGYAPMDWDTITTPGVYSVAPPGPYSNDAPSALGIYAYGQLVVTSSDASIQQIYLSHAGQMAIRQWFTGTIWSPWKQIATTDQTTHIVTSGSGAGYYWRKWSNGDIEQWFTGAAMTTEGSASFSFPIAFPAECKFVCPAIRTPSYGSSNNGWFQVCGAPSTTAVTIGLQAADTLGGASYTPLIYAVGH
ncbi:hypothetical protein EV210_111124 [Anaerospora hongkongensis]|uniref:Putative tail fiber protein gp53-like C-terminal domain-containing protein n=1 Tax=Anaerospora hongkongensis TaxID=244830 RepID=A0A4R1PX60_9FIRM|nr:pyocin knob domain-containing protein [Anaerospora hongkongensis]TCL35658.1 hypothetical protein EV210_111124 [Anaerospora hongkongensis]